ncbi:hypothetical protein L4D09_00185 [Photobacterium makurazakiensis]|uniref:hypothetical protein n=1 Tax=Photobacterium makurazakiensis TaxID=2910234 RepID=UPI003D1329A7
MDADQYKIANQPTKKLESLESFKGGLFELRSSGYTYKSLCDWLSTNGIEVSEHTVRRFFAKHSEDYLTYSKDIK